MVPSTSAGDVTKAGLAGVPVWRQVRWQVLTLLFLVTVINFIHRQTFSVVGPVVKQQFDMTNTAYGQIGTGFMLGMLVGEFPTGWLMDRIGVRGGLSFSVIWWSIAAGLHAVARSAMQFSIFRFWMGTGECGNFSGGMKVVSEWFPAREKALAVGVFNAGSMLGSMITIPMITFVMLRYGWHIAFVGPAFLGFVWVVLWRLVYRPLAGHPRVTQAELDYIHDGQPARQQNPPSSLLLLAHVQGWGLVLCRFLVGPVIQFYWLWLPEYLHTSRGWSLKEIGYAAWIPYVFGDIGSVGGGWAASFLMRRGMSLHASRKTTMWLGALCCTMSIAVVGATTENMAMVFICLVFFGHTWLSANMFAAISDIYPDAAVGRMTALTGIAGGASGALLPWMTGVLIDHFHSYAPIFIIVAFMPAAGVLCLTTMARKFNPVAV